MHSKKHMVQVVGFVCIRFWVHKALPSSKSKFSLEICENTQSVKTMTFKDMFMLVNRGK